MFDGILNVTLSEELFAIGVIQGNLELPLPPNSLYSTRHKNKIKSWTDSMLSFLLRRTHSLGRYD